MDEQSIPDLSPEERTAQKKEAKRLYNKAWHEAHPGYSARKSKAWRAEHHDRAVAYDITYKATHQAEIQAQQKLYRETHTEQRRESNRAWLQANAAHRRAYTRAYKQRYPERKQAADRRYRDKNSERLLARRRAYHHAHYHDPDFKGKQATRLRKWQQSNPGKVRVQNHRRLAHKAHAPMDDFTDEPWRVLCFVSHYECCYCGERFSIRDLTPDHLTPYAKGGSNTLQNILPACGPCKSRKGTRAVLCPVQPFLLLEHEEGLLDAHPAYRP